jgi:hypothetical protein
MVGQVLMDTIASLSRTDPAKLQEIPALLGRVTDALYGLGGGARSAADKLDGSDRDPKSPNYRTNSAAETSRDAPPSSERNVFSQGISDFWDRATKPPPTFRGWGGGSG